MQITADQCRGARGLLGWTQNELAAKAGVSRATVASFEAHARRPVGNNLRAIEACLVAAGVAFIAEDGNSGVGVGFRERKAGIAAQEARRAGRATGMTENA